MESGEFERVEVKNRAALKAADEAAIQANGCFTDPGWHEVMSPDGVRCFVISFVAPAQRALALPAHLTAIYRSLYFLEGPNAVNPTGTARRQTKIDNSFNAARSMNGPHP
jgi:hypothetical protein